MENASETVPDEGELTNFPSNGAWTTQGSTNSNSTLLFIAVEYVKDGNPPDFKFESDSNFSPQPSSYSEFEQHVSPLDPNMSSTAQYSPVYSPSAETTYNNSVVVMQDSVNPILTSDIGQNSNSSFINSSTNPPTYHLTSPDSPLDSIESPLSNSESQLLRHVVSNRYLQMVTTNVDEDDQNLQERNINIDFNQRSVDDEAQIIDKELQLVQFPINTYHHQLSMVDRGLKVDPDQVELLITDQNTGISYSGYVSQDFLVSRNTLPALPEDEQQLNTVLNTLESHGLVMESTENSDIHEVNAQNASLAIADVPLLLEDPILDSSLLLQAPVEISLDDSVLANTNSLVLKTNPPNNPIITESHSDTIDLENNVNNDLKTNKFNAFNVKEEHIDFEDVYIKNEFDSQNLRRSRRMNDKPGFEDDLCQIQSICDKPVPSRARATLPAGYLVINKLASTSPESDPVYGVFARRAIPKRTQFGPLEGVLLNTPLELSDNQNINGFKLLLESETGSMNRLDISDENTSNWMRFVRQAQHFGDQNLVLSQQGYSLYYTTTRTILPRQELQVGYSIVYATKRKLTTLKPEATDENSWSCFECPQRFNSSSDLQKHLNVHDESKEDEIKPRLKKINRFKRRPIDCPHCTRTFLRRHSLSRHLLQHTNPTIFRERQIRQIRRLNISTDLIDKTLEWKCDICCLYFPNPSLLNLHELVHKNEHEETITGLPLDLGSGCNEGEFLVHNGAVQCPQCGIEYQNRKLLIEHVSTHGHKQIWSSSKQEKKGFKCYMCYKAFAARDRLQRHMLVHGSEDSKPLKCDVCNKRFLNNSALQCHLKTHKLDKKIFECPICKLSFEQILSLKEHVRIHCVDGLFTCPHCNKNFKEYSIIRKHIRAFHCDRKHGCQYCGKPFPTLDKLRMHLLKHSDHREFLCSECGKQFKRKDKLKEHMKRMHSGDRELRFAQPKIIKGSANAKKFMPKVQPTDYHRFIYKCHKCMLGFKRRGMLVNHLAKRHPDISPESVPELNLPILKTTRDYYCQYCDKVYKSSSKRKAHILKNHPGFELPMSNRRKGGIPDIPGLPNPTFSQTVGSVTTNPHGCQWCHKQYASKAKLLQHQRKKHQELLPSNQKTPRIGGKGIGGPGQQPQSPGVPEEGKFMNSPDIPDETNVLVDDSIQTITENQLEVLNANGYIQCEDTKQGIAQIDLKQTFKLTEEPLNFDDCRASATSAQYYRLIQMPPNHLLPHNPDDESIDDPPESSRLYRLLTANNQNGPFPPYPPR